MRLHLVGGAASGKTSLALRLAEELDLNVFHLDAVAFDPTTTEEELAARRRQLLEEVEASRRSVTEGSFVGWAAPFFELADLLIFLDISAATALRRVIVRHVRASLRGTNGYKGVRRLLRFLLATRGWYASKGTHDEAYGLPFGTTGVTHLADTRAFVAGYSSKLVVCQTDSDVRRLTESLVSR